MIRPETIGVVGLGLVGRSLSVRLKASGFEVLGFDRSPTSVQVWEASGLPSVASPAVLMTQCRRVLLAVFDTAGVLEVMEGPEGLLQSDRLQAVIDCSTGDPDCLQALAERLLERTVDFIEAPLSGSSQQIERGEATMLLGGQQDALVRHADLLQALAPHRLIMGGAGMGARAKLATNLVLGLNRAALAEGMVFAERMGIDPARFLELVLATPARSEAAAIKGPLMVKGTFTPQSRIRQHLKDVELMLQKASEFGQRLPLTQAHATLLSAAVSAGDGELDNAAVVQQLRRETT